MEMEGCIVMKKFLGEFKEFALRGNVMDLAIGVIIGAAFQAIVTSLTGDIISPLLGLFGQVNFDSLAITVGQATIRYGAFLTAVLNFVIMALVIFLFVKLTNNGEKSQWRSKRLPQRFVPTAAPKFLWKQSAVPTALRCWTITNQTLFNSFVNSGGVIWRLKPWSIPQKK